MTLRSHMKKIVVDGPAQRAATTAMYRTGARSGGFVCNAAGASLVISTLTAPM